MEVPFDQIVDWIKVHTAHYKQEFIDKYMLYTIDPVKQVIDLLESCNDEKHAITHGLLNEWLAIDIYPEYAMERQETMQFLLELVQKYPLDRFD